MTAPDLNNSDAIWQQACTDLQLRLSRAVYNTFISNNRLVSLTPNQDGSLVGTIASPTAYHSIHVKKNFSHDLKSTLEKVTGKKISLLFEVGGRTVEPTTPPSAPQNFLSFQPSASASQVNSPRVEDLFSPASLDSGAEQRRQFLAQRSGIRPDYTFEAFAVSTTNEMAHAAAVAVSDSPGVTYNPLFFYGGVGVGKTHLMHAIGNNILRKNPQTKVLYSTGETFTNQIVKAIQSKNALQFKNLYRSVDVLLIDDVQFVAGKDAVQEEFFHTFNALVQQGRQVVLTSDRPPFEINRLEDRLRSRFEAGLMIDIGEPSFELRTAILLIKANNNRLNIPMDLAQLIASRVEGARRLEGVVKSLRSEVELKKQVITKELIEKLLNIDPSPQQKLRVKPGQVIKTVAEHFQLKQTAVRGKKRIKSLVLARHLAMYLLRSELNVSLTEIGRHFHDRDHTTVLHATEKIAQLLKADNQLQHDLSIIKNDLARFAK